MNIDKFNEGFSKMMDDQSPRTESQWRSTIESTFDCREADSFKLYGFFLGFSVLRPAGDGELYFDYVSSGNLYDFISMLRLG